VPTVTYQHTQPAHVVRAAVILTILALLAPLPFLPEDEPPVVDLRVWLLVFAGLMAVALVLFWSLTVQVTDEALVFWFGPGLIRKRIPLDEIADVEATRTTFWQGWGIHWTTRGWLYNISGFDAVLVRLRTGKSLLVGTDEPEALANAIREGVSPPRHL